MTPSLPPRRSHNAPQCDTSQDISDLAVRKVFALIGVDVNKPESLEELRADLRLSKKLRKMFDHGGLVLMALFMSAIMAAIWAGIATKVKGALR